MRFLPLIFIAFYCFPSLAQDSLKVQPLPRSTEFNLGIERHSHISNIGHATGITIGVIQPIGKRFSLQANSFLAPLTQLDPSKARVSELVEHDKTVRVPSCLVSSLTGTWSPIITRKNAIGKKGLKLRQNSWGIRAGYFFNQLTIPDWGFRKEFFQRDTTAIGEPMYTFGFRSHALSAGLELVSIKKTTKKTIITRYHVDFLQSVSFQYVGYTHLVDGTYIPYSSPKNGPNLQLAGMRLGYQYTHFRKGHWGGFYSIEAFWKPIYPYYANRDFAYPRGGEKLRTSAVSVRIGVVYRL